MLLYFGATVDLLTLLLLLLLLLLFEIPAFYSCTVLVFQSATQGHHSTMHRYAGKVKRSGQRWSGVKALFSC